MMNTIINFLKDAICIFTSVPRKQVVCAIASKGALKFSYAQSGSTSTKQFVRRAAIAALSDRA